MFGAWRLLLAIEVVAYHLADVVIIGRYAVFSFFVLSGFLMTAIMQDTYGYTPGGFGRYALNRALRLLPNYWFAATFAIVLILIFGEPTTRAYNAALTIPRSAGQWAENLTLIFANFYPRDQFPRLSPATWALTVEICYYVLIGLGASRSPRVTLAWLVLSIVYVVVAWRSPHSGDILYGAIPAGSLPFAAGAAAFHYREPIRRLLLRFPSDPRLLIAARWLLWLGIVAAHHVVGRDWIFVLGNWINIPLSALIVCALYFMPRDAGHRRIDKFLGDLSYPTYLLHWHCGLLASLALFGKPVRGPTPDGWIAFLVTIPATLLLGLVCARIIDPAVERRRSRVRRQAGGSPAPLAVHDASDPP